MSSQQFLKPFVLVFQGLTFGVGFGLSTWCIYHISQRLESPEMSSYSADASLTDKGNTQKSSLIVSDVEEHSSTDKTYFTGVIKNAGSRDVNAPNVEINLFLGGKFVDQYSTYITGKIVSGEQRYFKVGCTCKDSLPAKHDSFKVHLIGDNYP